MYPINFIKWKWLITKSIDDLVVWWWFELSLDLYEKIHKYVNKPLKLIAQYDWITEEFDCSICLDTKNHLQFVVDHWIVKLDIIIKNPLLIWYIIKSNIFLEI